MKCISGRGVRGAGRGYMNKNSLVLLHPLNNIKITNYFNYEPKFNGVFAKNSLPWIKDRANVKSPHDKNSKGTHWVSLFINKKNSCVLWFLWNWIYSQKLLNKIKDKPIIHNIFRIKDNESIMCGFYSIAFGEYMLAGKTFLDYTNFSFLTK